MAAQPRLATTRYCATTLGSNTMLMETTVSFAYNVETNSSNVTTEDEDLALNYLREGILQSLVNEHCKKKQREHPAPVSLIGRATGGGTRRRSRRLDLEVLSLHTGTAETPPALLENVDCPLTMPSSRSCDTFSNDIMMLLDSSLIQQHNDTQAQVADEVLATVQTYMDQGLYTGQVNHQLVKRGSSLVITAINYVALEDNLVSPALTVTISTVANSTMKDAVSGINNGSLTVAAITSQSQQQEANGPSNPFLTIVLAVIAGFLALLLFYLLWNRFKPCQRKKQNVVTKSFKVKNTANVPGDESLTLVQEIEDDDDYDDDADADADADYDSDTLDRFFDEPEKVVLKVDVVTTEPDNPIERETPTETSTDLLNSLDPEYLYAEFDDRADHDEMGNDPPGKLSLGADAKTFCTGKCTSSFCRSCQNAPDDDPNYLCPNFQLPGTKEGIDCCGRTVDSRTTRDKSSPSNNVNMRVFDEERKYHKADDASSKSMSAIVPPSQVQKSRTRSRVFPKVNSGNKSRTMTSQNNDGISFGFNSLLATQTSDDVTSTRRSYDSDFHRQRSVGPSRTVEL